MKLQFKGLISCQMLKKLIRKTKNLPRNFEMLDGMMIGYDYSDCVP